MDGRLRTCRLAALFLVLVLSATTRASALASTPAPAPLRIVPGQNEAAARCLGLILMSDKSVSQTQTDPRNLRIRAATFAIDMLGVLSSPGLRHSAGVLSFGSTAPASAAVGLRPLPDLTRELPTSLLAAPTLGGTDFPAAFARVEQLIRASLDRTVTRGCERRRFVVFVYSDLMPHSGSGGTDHEFREIGRAVRRLRDLGARIHVFAFSHHRRIDGLLRRWRDTGISSAVPVKALSDGGLERSYARVLAGELGLGEGGTARLSAASRRSSFVVPELSDRLIVVPFALSRTHVRLRSPSGEERDIHGIEAIHGPGAGRWSVTLLRGAATAVGTYAAPAAIRITRPARVVALGSDIRPEVTMATSTGAPIRATRSSVTVEATLSMAGQRPLHVELRDRGAGRFMATRAIDATGVGRLRVAVSVAVGSSEVRQVAVDAEVRRIPYLAFIATAPRGGRPLTVPLQLRLGGHAVDARQALGGSPGAVAVADLAASGRDIEQVPVRWVGGSRFEARFAHHGRADRRYTVNVQMVARAGQVVPSQPTTVSTVVTPRRAWLDEISRWGFLGLIMLLSILVLIVVAGVARMLLGGRIVDDVVVPVDGGTAAVYGGGHRLAMCGGPWPLRPLTFVFATRDGTVLALRARLPRPWGARPVARPHRSRRLRRPTTTPIRGGSR